MKKKIIFFDADGTIWYPASTKRTRKPHWIYLDPETKENCLELLELIPGAKETILKLKEKGLLLIVISASPNSPDVAKAELKEKLEFFGLLDLFHSYHVSSGDRPEDKGRVMLELINSLGVAKDDALMVGDSFSYDYQPARDIGVDAFFIENNYATMPEQIPADLQTIREASDLLEILE